LARIQVNDQEFKSVQFARLAPEQARKIHWASLEVLERIGARLHHQEAIDLLHRGGADVSDGNLVRIPSGMVERAFTTVPRRVVLYDRHAQPAMPLEGNRCFYGPGSDCMNIVDHRTGERRKPVLRDVAEGTTVCNALPDIDFVMSMVLPADVDQTVADTAQMEAMLSHTTKPIIAVSYELRGLVDAVQMAEVVAGGQDALRRSPLITCYINVVSGINHNKEALQKLLYLSAKGLPALYIPASTGGVTSPITPAGAVALDNAGVLLGLVLSQLNREGAPYIMTGMQPSPMDMRTMVTPYADPERGIFQAMARFYNLPAFGWGGVTDSKVVDQQAAAEAGLTLLAESLVGGNIIHDLGYLESGLTFSLAQLVICEEMIGWIEAFLRGVDVSEESLALDVIAQAGPEGHYLNKDHTRRHFREIWTPDLLERDDYKTWKGKGGKTLGERASERVETILCEHQPEPLPDDVKAQLRSIAERAGSKPMPSGSPMQGKHTGRPH
jgi:trimethylamine--corrinoid protein Co-methyltransferase